MIKKMRKIHLVRPEVIAGEARNKISEAINRTNLAGVVGGVELCYCSSLTAVVIISVTTYIVKIGNHSWEKIGIICFEQKQCVTRRGIQIKIDGYKCDWSWFPCYERSYCF